jgi:hypothetical protein
MLTVAFHNFANMPKIGLLPLETDAVTETCNNHRALYLWNYARKYFRPVSYKGYVTVPYFQNPTVPNI